MRRRSDRKKSIDVSSPAPTRRSRRRKSPSISETEKTEEKETAIEPETQNNVDRDSSEERGEPVRRGIGRTSRVRTPVKDAIKRKSSKREATSPKIIQKNDVIPEEENNGTERDEHESEHQLPPLMIEVKQVEEKKEIEKVRTVDTVDLSPPMPEAVEAAMQTEGQTLRVEVSRALESGEDESKDNPDAEDVTHIPVLSPQEKNNAKLDRKGNDFEVEAEVDLAKLRSKTSEEVVEESNDISLMAESPQEMEKYTTPVQAQCGKCEDASENKHQSSERLDQVEKAPLPAIEKNKLSRLSSSNNNTDNGRTTKTTIRKRKWLTKKGNDTRVLAISTDSLKNLIADVHPVPLSDVQLESSSEVEEIGSEREEGEESPTPERQRRRQSSDRVIVKRTFVVAAEQSPDAGAGNAVEAVQRSPSPALNNVSNVLYITNLVRPFTVLQLKGLLARTGKINDNGFWIDRIKSKCYVQYANEDEAVETRHALHGVRWPVSNPKCLNVEFGARVDMQLAIESTIEDTPKFGQDKNKDNVIVGSGWSRERGTDTEGKQRLGAKPVREWDVGKKDNQLEREKTRASVGGGGIGTEPRQSRERDTSESRENHKLEKEKLNRSKARDLRSSSVSPVRKLKKKENEPPLRLLDDLFRKTKTTPCIYWLPLTPEQIAEKEAFRQKRIEEHKQRIKLKEIERGREREKDRACGSGGGIAASGAVGRERERRVSRERDTHRRNRSGDRRRSHSRDRRRY